MAENPISIKRSFYTSKAENYIVTCHGHRVWTTVTDKPAVARRWLYKIRHLYSTFFYRRCMVVGLGVQWRQSYSPGKTTEPATLQLCVGCHCLIFQLIHAPHVPNCLRRFLADPGVTFVGISNYRDESLLLNSEHNLRVSNIVDVRDVASDQRGYSKRISMGTLADLILDMEGVEKPEWVGRSNWAAELLSEEQVQYACIDAFLSFLMGKELQVWNWVDSDP